MPMRESIRRHRSASHYIRFVVGADHEHHRLLVGLIHEAQALSESGALSEAEEQWLQAAFGWLNRNLPCPPFRRSRWPGDAVCWFKDHSLDAIAAVRALGVLLHEHGLPVRKLRSRNPGKILYEDDHQVVVKEWAAL